MLEMQLDAVCLRHGSFDDGRVWAKLTYREEKVTRTDTFVGNRVTELSIDSDNAKSIISKLSKPDVLPGLISVTCDMQTRKGAATLIITDVQ